MAVAVNEEAPEVLEVAQEKEPAAELQQQSPSPTVQPPKQEEFIPEADRLNHFKAELFFSRV